MDAGGPVKAPAVLHPLRPNAAPDAVASSDSCCTGLLTLLAREALGALCFDDCLPIPISGRIVLDTQGWNLDPERP